MAYAGEQLLMLWASGLAQLLSGRARGGVVALGLGGRGGRSGGFEFMADDFLGRLIGVVGEVGDGAQGVAGARSWRPRWLSGTEKCLCSWVERNDSSPPETR